MKKLLRKLLKCNTGAIWWRYGYHDFNTIDGRLKYRFWTLVDYWRERPRAWRWETANRMSLLASRLRGDRRYEVGYGAEANLAGMLEGELLLKILFNAPEDERDDALRDLSTLAGLAKATTWIEYRKILTENNALPIEDCAQ